MALSEDKKRLSIESGSGITPWEVAQCIGDYRTTALGRDVGLLCSSTQVNKWAKNKPIEAVSNQYGMQTDDQRKQAAYGFYWWNRTREADAPWATSATDLLNKAIANGSDWKYKQPTSVMRLGDFDGYNHGATNPFDYNHNMSGKGPINPKLTRVYCYNENGELKLSEFPTTGDDTLGLSGFDVVAVYRAKGSTGTASFMNSGKTVAQMESGDKYAQAEITLPNLSGGATSLEYDIIWAATNQFKTGSSDGNLWIYLPNSLGSLVLAEGFSLSYEWAAGDVFYAYDGSGKVITDDSGIVTKLYFCLESQSSFGQPIDVTYTFRIWDKREGYNSAVVKSFTNPSTDGFDGYVDIGVGDATANASNCMVTIEVKYREPDKTTDTYRHFNPATGTLEQYAPQERNGVSVLMIMNFVNRE